MKGHRHPREPWKEYLTITLFSLCLLIAVPVIFTSYLISTGLGKLKDKITKPII